MQADIKEKIQPLIEKILAEEGVELVEVKFGLAGHQIQIKVLADLPSGGITLGTCARVNKRIAAAIEEGNLIDSDYVIEVNSPGIDWPLTTQKDFARLIGRPVRIFLKETLEGKTEYEGVVRDAAVEAVSIAALEGDREIPLGIINKAVQKL